MRLDIKEQLEMAAAASSIYNHTSVALVSDSVPAEGEWSDPVQVKIERSDNPGIVDITFRTIKQ